MNPGLACNATAICVVSEPFDQQQHNSMGPFSDRLISCVLLSFSSLGLLNGSTIGRSQLATGC